jgi:Rrf2 family protein
MLSQKARYAIKALIALASAPRGAPLQTREIAERGDAIPRSFLEQILLELKRHRLVDSRRGKEGGYLLARNPADVSIGEIVRMMEGPIAPLSCLSRTSYRRCEDCFDESACALRLAFAEAFAAQLQVLENTTLAQVVARAEEARGLGATPPDFYLGADI